MFRFSILFVLSLSATLLMVGVGMIIALLPQRIHAMTGSLTSVGLIASVFALTYLVAQLPVGVLADKLGAKRFLVIGYLLCALSGLVFLMAETPGGIYLGRALQGLGEAPIWALGPAVLSLAYPASKGRAIGIYNAAIHAGLTLGPLLGLLIAPGGQASLPFLIFAILCFTGGLIVLVFAGVRALRGDPSKVTARDLLSIFRRRRAIVLLTGILLYGAGYGIFVSVLPVSLTQTHGFDSDAVSVLFVLFYGAVSLSQIVAGILSDGLGRHGFLVWGMILAAIGVGTFSLLPGFWVYAPLAGASIGLGVFCVASIADLNDSVPDALKGTISGSYYLFWAAGYVLGPILIGATAAQAPSLTFLGLSLMFAAMALALLAFGKGSIAEIAGGQDINQSEP